MFNWVTSVVLYLVFRNCAEFTRKVTSGQNQKDVLSWLDRVSSVWCLQVWSCGRYRGLLRLAILDSWIILLRSVALLSNIVSFHLIHNILARAVINLQSNLIPTHTDAILANPVKPVHIQSIIIYLTIQWSWLVLANLNGFCCFIDRVLELESVASPVVRDLTSGEDKINWCWLHRNAKHTHRQPLTDQVLLGISQRRQWWFLG